MQLTSPFTILICHGSYHTPEPYQPFIAALKEAGIEAICPQLPTSDLTKLDIGDISNPDYDRDIPYGGYPHPEVDITAILILLDELIEKEGRNVILLGHSYGGFVASAAALPPLQAPARKVHGKKGGIIGIFYACAFVIPVGESIHSFFQPKDDSPPIIPPFCVFHKHGLKGLASTQDGAKYFFNGLPEPEASYYESTLTASPVPTTVLANNAYGALPCTYLVTENDLALPAGYQEEMVALQNMEEGTDIKIVRCGSGHSPHLTWKLGMVEEVMRCGTEWLKKITEG